MKKSNLKYRIFLLKQSNLNSLMFLLVRILFASAIIYYVVQEYRAGIHGEAIRAHVSELSYFTSSSVNSVPKRDWTGQDILEDYKFCHGLKPWLEYNATSRVISNAISKHRRSDYGEPVLWVKSSVAPFARVLFSNYRCEFVPEETIREFIENGEDPKFLNTKMLDDKNSKH